MIHFIYVDAPCGLPVIEDPEQSQLIVRAVENRYGREDEAPTHLFESVHIQLQMTNLLLAVFAVIEFHAELVDKNVAASSPIIEILAEAGVFRQFLCYYLTKTVFVCQRIKVVVGVQGVKSVILRHGRMQPDARHPVVALRQPDRFAYAGELVYRIKLPEARRIKLALHVLIVRLEQYVKLEAQSDDDERPAHAPPSPQDQTGQSEPQIDDQRAKKVKTRKIEGGEQADLFLQRLPCLVEPERVPGGKGKVNAEQQGKHPCRTVPLPPRRA